MMKSPIFFALARTPGNNAPRTSRLLFWFACWLFTGDLCGCVAVQAVGCVLSTLRKTVLMWYSDVAALTSMCVFFTLNRSFYSSTVLVGHAELLLVVLSICFSIFSVQLLFWQWLVDRAGCRSCIFSEPKKRRGTCLNQASISALFIFISIYDFRFDSVSTCPVFFSLFQKPVSAQITKSTPSSCEGRATVACCRPASTTAAVAQHSAISHARSSEARTCRSELDNARKQTELARASMSSSICSSCSLCSQIQRINRNLPGGAIKIYDHKQLVLMREGFDFISNLNCFRVAFIMLAILVA